LIWLGLNFLAHGYLALPELPQPHVGRLPLATVLALGGLLAGLLTGFIARLAVIAQAKAKQTLASRTLRKAIFSLTQDQVILPVNAELQRHNRARQALDLLKKR